MREIEVDDCEWGRITRKLMTSTAEDALSGYDAPVRIVHGSEYVVYERRGADAADSIN